MQVWQRQSYVFFGLLAGIFILVGMLAVRFDVVFDLTKSGRNHLHKASIDVVRKIQQPVTVLAFTRGNPKVKHLILRQLKKYRPYIDLRLQFKHIDSELALVRRYEITRDGELVLSLLGQQTKVGDLSETSITRGLYRLTQPKKRHVILLTGYGQRQSTSAPQGYSEIKKTLAVNDIELSDINIGLLQAFPKDVDLLIIADGERPFGQKANDLLRRYIEQGGNVLWLSDVNSAPMPVLTRALGVIPGQGSLLKPSSAHSTLKNPRYIVIRPSTYRHDFKPLIDIEQFLLFPEATNVRVLPTEASNHWQVIPFLPLGKNMLIQRQHNIAKLFQAYNMGIALLRTVAQKQQRIVIIGDADFMSNAFIGQGQNRDFARQLIQYLTRVSADFIQLERRLPPAVSIDKKLLAYLALVFIVGLPLLIILGGWLYLRFDRRC